MSLFPELHFY